MTSVVAKTSIAIVAIGLPEILEEIGSTCAIFKFDGQKLSSFQRNEISLQSYTLNVVQKLLVFDCDNLAFT